MWEVKKTAMTEMVKRIPSLRQLVKAGLWRIGDNSATTGDRIRRNV
jgi:hypothetical protein